MGIHNFWSLVESSGRNISIETLRGKRLAVDISIWLNQIVRASRTKTGDVVPNAHIYIVILRLCKLLFYGIKPVIVFDGDAPALKKGTLKRRRERAKSAKTHMDDLKDELLLIDMASQIQNNVVSSGLVDTQESVPTPLNNPPDSEESAESNDEDIILHSEKQLQQLYHQQPSTKEILYVDLPYKSNK